MFKHLSDFNVVAKFKAETSASSSVSSRLPVILLQKSSHIPSLLNSIQYLILDKCGVACTKKIKFDAGWPFLLLFNS
jgi:hypothetical protein